MIPKKKKKKRQQNWKIKRLRNNEIKKMKKENQFNKDKISNKIDNNLDNYKYHDNNLDNNKYHDNNLDNNKDKNKINNTCNIINIDNSFKQESLKHINNIDNTKKNIKDNIKDNDNINTINDNPYKSEISIINNIKSLYIFKLIFDYIENKNFPYILFNYNKLNQKKLGLFLDSYKEKYEEQLELQNLKSIYVDSPLFKEKITNNTIYILLRNNHPQYTNTFNELLKKKI